MCETVVAGTKEVSSFLPFDQLWIKEEFFDSSIPSSVILFLQVLIRFFVSPFTSGMTDDRRMHQQVENVGYFQLFRYARLTDRLLVLVGALVSVVAGIAIPLLNINFGHMMDVYIQFDELSDFHHDLLLRPRNYTTFAVDFEGLLVEQVVDALSEIPIEVREFNEKSYMIAFNILAIGFVYFLLCYFFTVVLDKASATVMYRTRLKFYDCMLKHEVTWYDESFALAYASDMESKFAIIEDAIGKKIGFFLYMLSTSVCSLLTAVYYGWELTFVLLALTPAFALIFALVCRGQRSRLTTALKDRQNLNFVIREVISMIRVIVLYGGEVKQVLRVDRAIQKSIGSEMQFKTLSAIGYGLVWLSNYLTYAVGVWYGCKLLIVSRDAGTDDYTAGRIIIVFWNVLSITYFAGRTEPFIEAFESATAAAAEIFNLIQRESYSHVTGVRPNLFSPTIQFHSVSLNHALLDESSASSFSDNNKGSNSWSQTTRKCLKDVSLRVEEGKTLAVVGYPGSGKSLIPKLLTRIMEPQEGDILLGDIEIHNLNLQWLRSNIGYVGKDACIFDGTVYDNIWLGDRSSIKAAIVEAAKRADAFPFIQQLSHAGLDTVVGSKGKDLTPGQKQRIAIAKALLKNPQILILDRVTTCLPMHEQDDVVRAVEKARLRRTAVIVSDRINANVRNADHIVFLQNGQVHEQGSHDDLIQRKGRYYDMWVQQAVAQMTACLDDQSDGQDRSAEQKEEERGSGDPASNEQEHDAESHLPAMPYIDSGNEDEVLRGEQDQWEEITGAGEMGECARQLRTMGEESGSAAADVTITVVGDDTRDGITLSAAKLDSSSATSDSSSITGCSSGPGKSHGTRSDAPFAHTYSIRRIAKFMERDMVFVIGAGLCSALFGLGVPLYAILVGDFLTVLQDKDHDHMLQQTKVISGLFVGLSLLVSATSIASSVLFAIAGCRLTQRLRSQTMRSILSQDVNWLSGKAGDTGTVRDLVTSILCNDMESMADMVTLTAGSYCQTAGTVIACIVYSVHLNWRMGLVAITLMPFIIYRFRMMGTSGGSNKKKRSEMKCLSGSCDRLAAGGVCGQKEEDADLVPTHQSSDQEKTSKKLIHAVRTSSCLQQQMQLTPVFRKILQQDLQRKDGLLHMRGQALAVIQCIPVLAYGIVFLVGSHYIQQDTIHYSDFFKIVEGVIFGSILLSEGCAFSVPDSHHVKRGIAFLFHVIDARQLSDGSSAGFGSIPDGCHGHVHFSHVHYVTPSARAVLTSFSLVAEPGSSVAIVNQDPACGQAIACLLQKLSRPSAGVIRLDGHDISGMNSAWLRSKIALISSQPQLLSLSVGENIAFGDNNRYVGFAEVVDAAKAAGVHNFIRSLPLAYDTPLHSCVLTPEQRLRLSVARALLRDPVLLILDRVDDVMDGESMDVVLLHLFPLLKRGRTLISLTRRVGRMVAAHDRILLIENATVVQEGSHQDLMSRSGYYFDLYKLYQ